MKRSHILRLLIGIACIFAIASATFFFNGCNFKNTTHSLPAIINATSTETNYQPLRAVSKGTDLVVFEESLLGLNSISMQIRLKNLPADFVPTALVKDIDGNQKSFRASIVSQKEDLILMNEDMSIWSVEPSNSIKFDSKIPEGTIVEIWDMDAFSSAVSFSDGIRHNTPIYRGRMDFNGDGFVNSHDIILLTAWYQLPEPTIESVSIRARELWYDTKIPAKVLPSVEADDINMDGRIDSSDICFFIAWYQSFDKSLVSVNARAKEIWKDVIGNALRLPGDASGFTVPLNTTLSGLNTANLVIRIHNVEPTFDIGAFLPIKLDPFTTYVSWAPSIHYSIFDGVALVSTYADIAEIEAFSEIVFTRSLPEYAVLDLYNKEEDQIVVRIGEESLRAPLKPSIVVPMEGQEGLDRTPKIVGSTFLGAQGAAHFSSDWEVYKEATGHRVWRSHGNAVSLTVIVVDNKQGLFENSLQQATSLNATETYQVRVRYHDSKNMVSVWSDFATFTTKDFVAGEPDTPSILSPSDNQQELSPNLTLVSSAYVSPGIIDDHEYSTWAIYPIGGVMSDLTVVWRSVNTSKYLNRITVDDQHGEFLNALLGKTQLQQGAVYRVRVKYTNKLGLESEWSDTVDFKVASIVAFVPGSVLDLVVREQIRKAANEDIFSFELFPISTIMGQFDTLSGAQNLVNLQEITILRGGTIDSTFASIKDLRVLRNIHCRDNDLQTIPLLETKLLEEAYLSTNAIYEIDGLVNCRKLRILHLNENAIFDLLPLANLTALQELRLDSNTIINIDPLENLTNLRTLDLSKNKIVDISALDSMINIFDLKLAHNNIVDITPLSFVTNHFVRTDKNPEASLDLSNNQITDVDALVNMQGGTLRLQNNLIDSIEPFKNETFAPDKLYLGGNPCLSYYATSTIIENLRNRGIEVNTN